MIVNLKNKKRNFSTNSKIHSNIFSQAHGLMFTKPLKLNQSILIKFKKEKQEAIHMFFVFYPIDAVWLNQDYKIVHIERNIRPFTSLVDPKKKAIAILETQKEATINLRVGDKLIANNL